MALDGASFNKKANKSSSCSYNQDWEKTLPITSVRKNPGFFYYIPCSKMLSCAKIDRRDVERHCDPTKEDSLRNKNLKAKKISAQIPFTASASSSMHNTAVLRAEVMHTEFLVQQFSCFLLVVSSISFHCSWIEIDVKCIPTGRVCLP